MPTSDELLRDPLLKIERARHHINNLQSRVESFLANKPFVLMEKHRRRAGETDYYVEVRERIPTELPLIIGDAVHNLRGALDVTLFAMVGDIEPRIYFPFPRGERPTPEDIEQSIKKAHATAAGPKVVGTIKSLEPYIFGKGIALSCVHQLDVQDKHRLLILAGHRAAILVGTGQENFLPNALIQATPTTRRVIVLDAPEGAVALQIRRAYATRHLPDPVNEVRPQPDFAITFGDNELLAGTPVVETLDDMASKTEDAVRGLADAFLDPSNST